MEDTSHTSTAPVHYLARRTVHSVRELRERREGVDLGGRECTRAPGAKWRGEGARRHTAEDREYDSREGKARHVEECAGRGERRRRGRKGSQSWGIGKLRREGIVLPELGTAVARMRADDDGRERRKRRSRRTRVPGGPTAADYSRSAYTRRACAACSSPSLRTTCSDIIIFCA
jgi:hypothetical protein